ncbi:EAL domain-containing protein [Sphingopyxis sp. BSNA05]|uniref:EAL domain-containing protein n=1 Tax=Sphingopyxis sp. BSNA05 TaxID=1236614 RepID=UPI00349F1E96
MVRAEALARWKSPVIGEIMPTRFIEVAEESGLIANITLAVLKQAIAALKSWKDPIPLSINLSGHDLISDQIISQIIAQVQASELDPALLEFEVTETAMMADTHKASSNMLRLAALGHPLALDDFGTGYSNFSYLRTLPISKLKVDRSFMKDVSDPMTEKILHSLVGMARTLGVDCLLEGVEDEIQLVLAKRVGTHMVQGYLFGIPMTDGELLTSLAGQDAVAEDVVALDAVNG